MVQKENKMNETGRLVGVGVCRSICIIVFSSSSSLFLSYSIGELSPVCPCLVCGNVCLQVYTLKANGAQNIHENSLVKKKANERKGKEFSRRKWAKRQRDPLKQSQTEMGPEKEKKMKKKGISE